MIFGFKDSVTIVMDGIIDLHNYIFFYLIIIFCFVLVMFTSIIKQFYFDQHSVSVESDLVLRSDLVHSAEVVHGTWLEVVWTITPSLILAVIAAPSFALLYAMDEIIDPVITIKIIGHQWYWTYDYTDFLPILADSYMIPEFLLKDGDFRLLEVDNSSFLPSDTPIRVLVTSADVLHSWAVPQFGVKIDSVPGRLNQVSLMIKREGVFYGQCSEICGVYHGSMPIRVVVLDYSDFEEMFGSLKFDISIIYSDFLYESEQE